MVIVSISNDPVEACARLVATELDRAVSARGRASLAVSGGSTAPSLFDALAGFERDWSSLGVWQVDERVAPDGHDDRNAGQLEVLPDAVARHLMPVTDHDLDAAAARYGEALPAAFDVVHLGLGDDGHSASWAPLPHPEARRVLTSTAPVSTISAFNGRARMTLGTSVVNTARVRVVLVTGASKAQVVADWVRRSRRTGTAWIDPELPIAAVDPTDTTLFLDDAAASELEPDDLETVDVKPGGV